VEGRWGVPVLSRADGGEGEARASSAGPIIGRLGRCPGSEIFLVAALIHHSCSWLTSSGHVTMAIACPHAHQSALAATLVARRSGDHGASH
jgi:hypothetical protein